MFVSQYVLYYPPNKRYVPLRHGMEGMEPDELEGLRKRMREMVKQDYVALTEIQEGMQQGTGTCAVEEELVLADNTTEAQRDEDTPRGKDAFFLYSSDDEEEETVMPMSLPVLPEESRELKHATPNAQGTSRPRPGKGRNTPHPGKGKSIPNSDRVHVAGSKSNRMPYNHSTHVARVESSITALPRRSRAEGGRKRRPKKR
ncbi:unnamed protein product [Ostreobium quekettii]|uniref:Uncharacterized protein n=1 Tax=Ostreobium quekettii TaxID=121088 RepID=A0A8S1IRQ1_9CHLO|nr:unnamed protein product [Ostreobium quekettii]